MPSGEIEPRQVARLREIGDWLGRNGEAVYDTRGGPFRPGAWGASTRRERTVFLHVFEVGSDSWLRLPAIAHRVEAARVLGSGGTRWRQAPEGLEVHAPALRPGEAPAVIALDLDGPAAELVPV